MGSYTPHARRRVARDLRHATRRASAGRSALDVTTDARPRPSGSAASPGPLRRRPDHAAFAPDEFARGTVEGSAPGSHDDRDCGPSYTHHGSGVRPRHDVGPDRPGERARRNDHPARPGARVPEPRRTERRPAHVALGVSPGDPGGGPDVTGHPEPAQAGAESPAAVVEDDRAPRNGGDE